MMTQEEFMDVLAMRRRGMTYVEIAYETGYQPDRDAHMELDPEGVLV